ncbi:hypothetical protein ABPG75_007847 [Micractinium tetrahymenae]
MSVAAERGGRVLGMLAPGLLSVRNIFFKLLNTEDRLRMARRGIANRPWPPAILDHLTDDLLVRCLAFLTPRERFNVAALVCKRFRQLCLAPELLRCVQLAVVGERAVPRCRGLLAFLLAHAQHVRRLTLHACISEARPEEAPDGELGDPALRLELQGVLQQCCAALGAAGAAEEVILSAATPVADAAWLASLPRLRLLWVGTDDAPLELPAGFSRLRLREVGLRGRTVRLADPCLPPGVTRLHLAGSGAAEMLPQQLPHLTCLSALELLDTDLPGASLSGLTALPSLRAIQLDGQAELPACLPALTQLRQLELHSTRELAASEVEIARAALSSLTGLTALVFGCFPLLALPREVTCLTALHHLLFFTPLVPPEPTGLPLAAGSPASRTAWLAGIRWLGLPYEVAARSVAALRAATRLEYLGLVDTPMLGDPWADEAAEGEPTEEEAAAWEAFWAFCAQHPPLRALGLDIDKAEEPELTMPLLDALVRLARRRPALAIRRTPMRPPGQQYDWCRSSVRARGEFFHLWEEMANHASLPELE